MRERFVPEFDFQAAIVEPWSLYFGSTVWIVLMGFLVAATCGLVGCFIVLRRMALVGDAISHSVLPGIVLAFLITQSRATFPMLVGAIVAGAVTVVLIEGIRRYSRVKQDAAIGIVFSSLFAVGVALIAGFADHVDLDTDCVLYGEIAFVPLENFATLGGVAIAPLTVARMAVIFVVVIVLIVAFYKELVVTSFDAGLAASLGISPALYQYGLTLLLSVVIVSSFESVGVVLVIAMIIFPGATSMLLTDRLPVALGLSCGFSAVYAVAGFHLATWLDASIAGAMSVVAGAVFGVVWVAAPRRGLARRWLRARGPALEGEAV